MSINFLFVIEQVELDEWFILFLKGSGTICKGNV